MKYEIQCDNEDCPKDWESLDPSGHGHLRFCSICFKNVLLTETEEDAEVCKAQGKTFARPRE